MAKRQSSSERQSLNPKRIIPANKFLKKHPQPVILHFQPTGFIPMETPEELQQWEKMVRDMVGLDLSAKEGGTESQTTCAPPPGKYEVVDDCDAD
jgi:hypothetical protein